MTTTGIMRGIIQTGFGEPDDVLRIGDVAEPAANDDTVLVRVRAASIHIGAVYRVRGFPRVMRPDGLSLANGAAAPAGWFGGLGHPLKVAISSVFSKQQGRPFVSTENHDDLATLRHLAETGAIAPEIDEVYPIHAGVDAITSVGAGHNRGTTVIAM